jgi:hypothetical protein
MNATRIAVVSLAALFAAACTKPAPTDAAGATPATDSGATAASVETPAPAAAAATLHNVYASSALTADGAAGEPSKAFKTSDKVYVSAVVHGQASAAAVKIEWTAEGATAPSSEETSIPVTGSSVATVELTKAAALAAGKYKVMVYLDGAPAWELALDVTQ